MGACWSSSSAAEDGRPLRITRRRGRSNSPSTKKSVRLTERRVHMLTTLSEVPDHIGLDIGGTLAKVVVASKRDGGDVGAAAEAFEGNADLTFTARVEGDGADDESAGATGSPGAAGPSGVAGAEQELRLQFSELRSEQLESYVHILRKLRLDRRDMSPDAAQRPLRKIVTAGGGGHKFAALFREALRVQLVPFREMQSVVDGLLFLSHYGPPDELFSVDSAGSDVTEQWPENLFPLLLVNMGSGVSVLQVDAEHHFTRVGGTACGGATFLGLSRLLTGESNFEALIELAARGDVSRVDKTVGDIYGPDGCSDIGMPAHLTAANFGKLATRTDEDGIELPQKDKPEPADMVKGVLHMVVQASVLQAKAHAGQIGAMDRVFFVGGFLHRNAIARALIADAMRLLGGHAYFCKHCDFLGAIGSLSESLHQDATTAAFCTRSPAAAARRARATPPATEPSASPFRSRTSPRRRSANGEVSLGWGNFKLNADTEGTLPLKTPTSPRTNLRYAVGAKGRRHVHAGGADESASHVWATKNQRGGLLAGELIEQQTGQQIEKDGLLSGIVIAESEGFAGEAMGTGTPMMTSTAGVGERNGEAPISPIITPISSPISPCKST